MPTTINVYSDFPELYNLQKLKNITTLKGKILLQGEHELTLDLRSCLLDYDRTSRIIDHVFDQVESNFCLVLQLNYLMKKDVILNWLFLGSEHFGLQAQHSLDSATIEKAISQALGAAQQIRIEIYSFNSNEIRHVHEYSQGGGH